MTTQTLPFKETWLADFEFTQHTGDNPSPVCMVAQEFGSGRVIRCFQDELIKMSRAPFRTDPEALFVSYYAPAEISCFLALGWPVPERILDLFAEFRNMTNGVQLPHGKTLLAAMAHFGLNCIDAVEKDEMRQLAIRGGPYTPDEELALLDYCKGDVDCLSQLLGRMWPRIDLPRALLRGRYMVAVARMERTGVPIDMPTFHRLGNHWGSVKSMLLERHDRHGIWDNGTFKADRFAEFLGRHGIGWPCKNGRLVLDDREFRSQAQAHPVIAPIRELRHTLSQLRLNELAIGTDGRNRCMLSPLRSKTGRNQPSNSKFIFGPSVWLRGLIKPPPGHALAYIDWSQQEFGCAAALSGDTAMMEAYASGDPYLAFAKQAGAVPADATKQSHPAERARFKICALAVQYGMGEVSLAEKLGETVAAARELLRLHRSTYSRYWRWNDDLVDSALLGVSLRTVFGWQLQSSEKAKTKSLANFPMQANGAEMLRLACCLATEAGINACAPVHDALLIMADVDKISEAVAVTQAAMAEASRLVLTRLELRTDVKVFQHPDRYADERGTEMWVNVMTILNELEAQRAA